MTKWLLSLLLASFFSPIFADEPIYLFCPVSDARLPGPNVKVTKNFWGTRKLYVLERGVWTEKELQLDSDETQLIYQDTWGPTGGECKDKSVSGHCPTIKNISLLVLAREAGLEYSVVKQWTTKRCCYEGKIVNPGDYVGGAPCLIMKLAK